VCFPPLLIPKKTTYPIPYSHIPISISFLPFPFLFYHFTHAVLNGVLIEALRYQTESTAFITTKVAEWERQRLGDRDPDETEDEGEPEAVADGEKEFVMQGVMQSVRVPVI
jgi:hypothetical protein